MVTASAAHPSPVMGDLLGQEVALLQAFVELLQQEQALLKAGSGEALLTLVETKNALATQLGELAQTREKQLAALGLPGGPAGMAAWLDQHANAAECSLWHAFLKLAGEARDLNLLNGKLIGLHMQHNQQALTALTAAADRATTYGPDGQQQSSIGSRILGKA